MSTNCCLTLRTITDYTALGTLFLEKKATLLKVEFQRFKERNGKSFVEQFICIHNWWQQLSTNLQETILQLPFANISRSGLIRLTKIPPEHLHLWCEQINLLVRDRGYLKPSDMASLAKSLIPKVKRHLKLDEPIEDGDFLLVAKKYRFSPEQLVHFQDMCNKLADALTTEHLLQIIEQWELDPLKLLTIGDRQDYLLFKKDQEIKQLLLQLIEALKHSEKKAPSEEKHHHEAISLDDNVLENYHDEAVSLDDNVLKNYHDEAVSLDDNVLENDNTPSIQEQKLDTGRNGDEKIPEHPAQYIKNAEVGILKEGVIVERGRMIGQLGKKVRVLCQKNRNKLFDLTDLVLLSVPKPQKKKRSILAEIKSLSSV